MICTEMQLSVVYLIQTNVSQKQKLSNYNSQLLS